jgi:hypothetical protein
MAEHKVQGGDMLLFIDPTGGTDYDIVVCLTSVGKSDSVTVVDASSMCGPDKSPGTVEISYSFEGQHLQDPDGGSISGTDLRQLLRSETTIGWKIAPENPVAGDEIEEGTGYLSELSSTYAFDSVGTFTGAIQPFGVPTLSVFGSSSLVVGQPYQGGIIAWLTGDLQNGIIITGGNIIGGSIVADFSGAWSTPSNNVTGATLTAYGGATANQAAIIANTATSLALDCENLSYGGYNDWKLPTVLDMSQIIENWSVLNIVNGIYCTSTENDANTVVCWDINSLPGSTIIFNKGTFLDALAIRYF